MPKLKVCLTYCLYNEKTKKIQIPAVNQLAKYFD